MVVGKTPVATTGVIPFFTSGMRILEETVVFYHKIGSEQPESNRASQCTQNPKQCSWGWTVAEATMD